MGIYLLKEEQALNPLTTATQGKGLWNTLKRTRAISRRYGLTTRNMDQTLRRFADILGEFNGKATFPITGAALARSRDFTGKYQGENIEFAAHGYFHVDHRQLSLAEQTEQFNSVSRLFSACGIVPNGFRCPYLRWSDDTVTAIKQAAFKYDSSQALVWDVGDVESITEPYRRVLNFYGALPAARYPALPRWDNGLVRIPYCLPDDEALIDRLSFASPAAMDQIWPEILSETHRLGELFTLGLHPERLDLCETALIKTFRLAADLSPAVWCARLDEVVQWWKARTDTLVTISGDEGEPIRIAVRGPDGVTILARNLNVVAESTTWNGSYRQIHANDFTLLAEKRPFIGVSPASDPYLTSFLRQQGYIVEPAVTGEKHSIFIDNPHFTYQDERPLLTQIEQGNFPLVRLSRWPYGAQSALCITGDIDALTIWDYGLRFLGN